MDIQNLFRALWRKKWILIITPIIAAVLALFFLQYKKPVYQSTARLSTGFTDTDRIDMGFGQVSLRDADVKFKNLLEMMNESVVYNLTSYQLLLHDLDSMEVAFKTPRAVDLDQKEGFFVEAKETITDKFSSDEEINDVYDLHTQEEIDTVVSILKRRLVNMKPLHSDDKDFEIVRRFLLEYGYSYSTVNNLGIGRIPNTDYVEVTFSSGNNELAAHIVNTYCDQFLRYYYRRQGGATQESVAVLEEMADRKKEILDEKLDKLRQLRASTGLTAGTEGSQGMSQLIDLENQRDEISSSIQEIRLRLQRLRADLAGVQQPGAQNGEIISLQNQISDMNARYISTGSRDKQLSDSIAMMRSKLNTAVASINNTSSSSSRSPTELADAIKDAEIQYQVASNRLEQINHKIQEVRIGLSGQAAQDARYAAIQNEIDVATKEYTEVANRYSAARNKQEAGGTIRQVVSATPALSPSGIPNMIIVAMAAFACLGMALLVIIIKEIVDDSIKTATKFKQKVRLPLIGTVNLLNNKELKVQEIFADGKSGGGDPEEEQMYKASIRSIRHQLELMNSKTFLFTSLREKDGKSFLIYSLAYAMSLLQKKVLVIDTNFKSSSITKIYGMGSQKIKVLQHKMMSPNRLLETGDRATVENEVTPQGEMTMVKEPKQKTHSKAQAKNLVNPTKFEGVYFIGNNGLSEKSPAELLSSKDFSSFIEYMSEQFDYIFMEGASLDTHSDGHELMVFADKVVTVFSADTKITPRDKNVISSVKTADGNKLAGAILNKIDKDDMAL